jgi:hypothetical protein
MKKWNDEFPAVIASDEFSSVFDTGDLGRERRRSQVAKIGIPKGHGKTVNHPVTTK